MCTTFSRPNNLPRINLCLIFNKDSTHLNLINVLYIYISACVLGKIILYQKQNVALYPNMESDIISICFYFVNVLSTRLETYILFLFLFMTICKEIGDSINVYLPADSLRLNLISHYLCLNSSQNT